MTSLPGAPTRSRQQPTPAIVTVVVSLIQSPCAISGVVVLSAVVPQPGGFCFGGSEYWFTVTSVLLKLSAGELLSEDVFASFQRTIWVDM